MKPSILISLLLSLPHAVVAGPKEDARQNQNTRRSATELFRTGSNASAVEYLRQNLRPEPGPGGDATSLPQNLIEIAVGFFNRREMRYAKEVTLQAQLAANPILNAPGQSTTQRKADLYSSLGLLHEMVLFDLRTAQFCYESALALNPADKLSQRRKADVVAKQLRKNGGAR